MLPEPHGVCDAFGQGIWPSADVAERGQDFQVTRNDFIKCMEGHEVPASTVKHLVGHARQSMTFGH
jgi:hypothetical protein